MLATQTHAATATAPTLRATSVAGTDTLELDSNCLLCGQREVLIRHGNQCYRLRHTRSGKLILTK